MSFLNHRAAIDSLNESIAALRRWRVLRWTKAAAKPCPARGPPLDGRAASRSAIVLHRRDRLNGQAGQDVREKLPQNGRVSCRERVCPYVLIRVGARYNKKKKK